MKRRLKLRYSMLFLLLSLVFMAACSATTTPPAATDSTPSQPTEPAPTPAPTPPPFPEREIQLIVPYDAGGGFDIYARALAPFIEKHLPKKVSVVVMNVAGAGGETGATNLYRAKADGYTIGIVNIPGLITSVLKGTANYDLEKYTWLGRIAEGVQVLALSPASEFKTFAEVQKADRKIKIGSAGLASSAGMATVVAVEHMKMDAQIIPYTTGSREAVLAAMRGEVDAILFPFPTLRQHFQGDLIPGVIFSREPYPEDTLIPTITSAGFAELADVTSTHYVLAAPPEVPGPVASILNDAVAKALADPEFVAWTVASKRPIAPLSGAESLKMVQTNLRLFTEYKGILLGQ